jgi:copper chaperone NosL
MAARRAVAPLRAGLLLAAIVSVAAGSGCGASAAGPPDIQVDRTACSHCGMLISEPAYAAAYRVPGGEGRAFDDIGCLLAAAGHEPASAAPRFWFHDAGTGAWIEGTGAVFVKAPGLRTPMAGGVIAFATRDGAREAALRYGGAVVDSLDDLRRTYRQGEP